MLAIDFIINSARKETETSNKGATAKKCNVAVNTNFLDSNAGSFRKRNFLGIYIDSLHTEQGLVPSFNIPKQKEVSIKEN